MTRDELHGRLVGLGHRDVRTRHLGRILTREQRRICARDTHTRRTGFIGRCDRVIIPGGRVVEGAVGGVSIPRDGGFVVCEECRDEFRAKLVGMRRDQADQWQSVDGRCNDQLLAGLQTGADAHSDLGKSVQLFIECKGGEGRGSERGGRRHSYRVGRSEAKRNRRANSGRGGSEFAEAGKVAEQGSRDDERR